MLVLLNLPTATLMLEQVRLVLPYVNSINAAKFGY